MYRLYFFLFFISNAFIALGQQDFQATQFIYDKLNVNPAFAGANFTSTISLFNNSILGNGTALASAQIARATTKLLDKNVGLALNLESYTIGSFKSSEISAVYAYHIRLGDERYVSFGLEGTFRTTRMRIFQDPFQPPINFNQVEAQFGGLYYDQSTYIGFAAQNLFGSQLKDPFGGRIPVTSGNRLFRSMFGATFPISEASEIQPNVQLAYAQGSPLGYDMNVMYVWNRIFSVGLSYRYADFRESIVRNNLDFIVQLQVSKRLLIGSGLSFPQSSTSVQTGGAEFSAIWVWSAQERPHREMPFF